MSIWRTHPHKNEVLSDKIADELKEFSFQRLTKPKTPSKVFQNRDKVHRALVVVAVVESILGLMAGYWLGRL
jgi:hypothetical protein